MRQDIEILQGAFDTHLHTGPSIFPRLLDAMEAAQAAKKAGMKGILLKHHHTPTMDRAYFVNKVVPEVEVYGGVTLNYASGGLNPFAVDAALKLGGKIVWMPTVDARNHINHFGELGKYGSLLDYKKPAFYEEAKGITVFDNDGRLKPKLCEILDIIAEADAAIATSHLDFKESNALIDEAKSRGVNRIVVTHVAFVTASLTIEEQKSMAEKSAFLELCYSSLSPAWGCTSIDKVVEALKEVGPEHYILSSDLGQIHNPPPPEGIRIYIRMLLERGIEPDDIRLMVKDNPKRLLKLED